MFKKISLCFIFMVSFAMSSSQGVNQINQVQGTYLGRVGNGYSFCSKIAPGIEEEVVFDEILSVILENYPLHAEDEVGKSFTVSFVKNFMIGENGGAEILTIVRLQKLKYGKHN